MELRSATGQPLPGFSLADCDETGGNYTSRTVTWKAASDLSSLAGQPVRLHTTKRATKLCAFQFE